MASIFTPTRTTVVNRLVNRKTHNNSKTTLNFAIRQPEKFDLFTTDGNTTSSEQDACFSVEFAMMSFEEQLIRCQLEEADLKR